MKNLLVIMSVFLATINFAQKTPETCNQLPYANVDEQATITNDVNKLVATNLPDDMKKGEFTARFKFYVDCKGQIEKHTYAGGNLDEVQETWLTNVLGKSEWKAAVFNDLYVTSLVFLSVSVKNGQVTVEVFGRN